MLILTIRTDKPEAEIGLYDDDRKLAYETWPAHRQLAETLHSKIMELLQSQDKSLDDIQAVVAYKGPGSFTGLRIGLSVANALASSLKLPITGSTGEGWIKAGRPQLNKPGQLVMPEYGAPVHITQPKK
jgi:tRNA threonylcarbamoyladenosine biosynthesis protein TsaB